MTSYIVLVFSGGIFSHELTRPCLTSRRSKIITSKLEFENHDYHTFMVVLQVGGNFSSTVIGKHMKMGGKVIVIGNMSEHGKTPIGNFRKYF